MHRIPRDHPAFAGAVNIKKAWAPKIRSVRQQACGCSPAPSSTRWITPLTDCFTWPCSVVHSRMPGSRRSTALPCVLDGAARQQARRPGRLPRPRRYRPVSSVNESLPSSPKSLAVQILSTTKSFPPRSIRRLADGRCPAGSRGLRRRRGSDPPRSHLAQPAPSCRELSVSGPTIRSWPAG